jgi:histone deacetylase 1/2
MVLAAKTPALMHALIGKLKTAFAIKDMGPVSYFLGVEVCRSPDGFFLSQAQSINDILDRAGMRNCKHVTTSAEDKPKPSMLDGKPVSAADASFFRSITSALQYMTLTRPDIAYAVQQLYLHMHSPTVAHVTMMKRVLRYVKETPHIGVKLRTSSYMTLTAYSDADWADCLDTRCSTSGFCVFLSDALVSWSS